MDLRRACLLAVPLLTAGLLAVPATASPAARAAVDPLQRLASLPPGSTVLHAAPGGDPARVRAVQESLTSGPRGDVASWLRRTAQGLGSGALVLEESAQVDVTVEVVQAGAVPAGDLDGDGREDVLALFVHPAGDLAVAALRGTDGQRLWAQPVTADTGLAWPVGQDLTGDGRDDLLLLDWTFVEGASGAEVEQTYGVVDGADGTRVWATAVVGRVEERGTSSSAPLGVLQRDEYSFTATDLVLPYLSPDLTADGTPDLAVTTLDVSSAYTGTVVRADRAGAGRWTETSRSSVTAAVVDGRSGVSSVVRTAADQAGVSFLEPVGDLDGDGAGELVWTAESHPDVDVACAHVAVAEECLDRSGGTPRVTVELLEGTGQTRWSAAADGFAAWLLPAGGDLDDDGVADLVLEVFSEGRSVLLSGASGTQLWEVSAEGAPFVLGVEPTPTGPVAVLGALQLAVAAPAGPPGEEPPPSSLEADVVIERRAGATGELVSREQHDVLLAEHEGAQDGGVFAYFVPLADGDGDGARELSFGTVSIVGEEEQHDDGWTWTTLAARSAWHVEPLAGGPVLLSDWIDEEAYLAPYGDLDGDGLQDLLLDIATTSDDVPWGTDALAFGLPGYRELWRWSGPLWRLPRPAGDQDGATGDEVLMTWQDGDDLVVSSLRGQDLAGRWEVRPGRPNLPSAG